MAWQLCYGSQLPCLRPESAVLTARTFVPRCLRRCRSRRRPASGYRSRCPLCLGAAAPCRCETGSGSHQGRDVCSCMAEKGHSAGPSAAAQRTAGTPRNKARCQSGRGRAQRPSSMQAASGSARNYPDAAPDRIKVPDGRTAASRERRMGTPSAGAGRSGPICPAITTMPTNGQQHPYTG
jgi:hypothetical protein